SGKSASRGCPSRHLAAEAGLQGGLRWRLLFAAREQRPESRLSGPQVGDSAWKSPRGIDFRGSAVNLGRASSIPVSAIFLALPRGATQVSMRPSTPVSTLLFVISLLAG